MQLLLLLTAMIVARSQCAQWVLQQRGQNDNTVMAGDEKELKSAAEQTLSAHAGEYNLQKLLGFKHAPLYEWVPATKTSSVFSELLDNADVEDPSIGQQVLQSATEDSENELLTRLLQLYDPLPAQTSKWRKRRRRQDEEVQPGTGTAGLPRHCQDAALDCSDNSSSAMPPVGHDIDEALMERETDVAPPHDDLHGRRREDGEKTACGQEQSSNDGRMKRQADGEQTEDGEVSQKDYAYKFSGSGWDGKRATPFSVVGTAWRRAFNSWGGKRNPAFHSWGGKRSNSFAVLGKSRSWGARTDPSLGSENGPAFTMVGSRTYVPAVLSITDEPTVAVFSSKTKPALSTLRPKRDTAFVIWDDKSKPAFKIPNNHDNPTLTILEPADKTTPVYGKRYRAFGSWGGKRASVFSSWGGKRDVETPDWEDQAKGFRRGPQFSIWDGNMYFDDDTQEKRGFSSWGGKRNLISDDVTGLIDEMSKRRYSSWGGKRDTTKIEQNLQNSAITTNSEAEHGPWQSDKERRNASIQTSLVPAYQELLKNADCKMQFRCEDNYRRKGNGEEKEARPDTETSLPAAEDQNSRSSELHGEIADHELLGTVMKRSDTTASGRTRVGKALFKPWGGKRSQVLPSLVSILGSMHRVDGLLNKRAITQYESLGSKKWGQSPSSAVFSSWGGKRSRKLTGHNIQNAPTQSIGRQFRRAAEFYSWAGKR